MKNSRSISMLHFFIVTLCLCFTAVKMPSQTGGTFDLSRAVVAAGGGSDSAGGTFKVDGTAGQGFAGTTSNASAFDLYGGFWFQNQSSTAAPQITGTVTYGNAIGAPNPRFVSNVTITGAGSPNVTASTAPPGATAGQYTLSGFGAGSYTVTPAKIGGVNGISSFDAARVAQHVAGTGQGPFTTNAQRISADVTGNGVINSFDAAKIAQYAAGLPLQAPNLSGTWRFFVPNPTFPLGASPTSRTYASVTSNITGDDYIGILGGEVTGNWTPSAARTTTDDGTVKLF